MRVWWFGLLGCVALCVVSACGDDPVAASMDAYVLEMEPGLGLRLDAVRVLLSRADDGREVQGYELTPSYSGTTFDALSARVHPERQSDAGRVLYVLRAEGVSAGQVVVAVQHRLVFVPERRIVVPMRFASSCVRVDCADGSTCIAGGCVDDFIPACTLEGSRSDYCLDAPDLGLLSTMDAGDGEAAPRDAEAEADLDAGDTGDRFDASDVGPAPDAGDDPGCTCVDDGLRCTVAYCAPDGVCIVEAAPDGTACGDADGAQCCDGECVSLVASPAHCGGCGRACPESLPSCSFGTCVSCATASDCADDGSSCTTTRCSESSGACVHALQANRCLIDSSCYPDGASSPTNPCLVCDSSADQVGWSDSTAPCDDGLRCTTADRCVGGACVGSSMACSDALTCTTDACDEASGTCRSTLAPTSCLIAGACVAEGTLRPGNQCEGCDPALDPSDWSDRSGQACDDGLACTVADRCNGTSCDGNLDCSDGLACTLDACGIDGCSHALVAAVCLIAGACVPDRSPNPANFCQRCDVTVSTSAWTNRTAPGDDACNDGNFCTLGETCQVDGRCAGGAPRSCADGIPCTEDSCDPGPPGTCVHVSSCDAGP